MQWEALWYMVNYSELPSYYLFVNMISELLFYLGLVTERIYIKQEIILFWSLYLLWLPEKYMSLVKTFWNLFLYLLIHLANIHCAPPRWEILLAALWIKHWAKISRESYSHRIYILLWDVAFENGQGINKQPCLKMKVVPKYFGTNYGYTLLSEPVCVCSRSVQWKPYF